MDIEDIPYQWVRDEVHFPGEMSQGIRRPSVRKVQEWLTYHGFPTAVDGDFGGATRESLLEFQRRRRRKATGVVDEATWSALVAPVFAALEPIDAGGRPLSELVLDYARQHVALHPIEVGGANAGPWVRIYMQGNEGDAWPWCAGFVTFVLRQAVDTLESRMPIAGSFSCDTLAAQARAARRLRPASAFEGANGACIFLVRRTDTDWTHTGFANAVGRETMRTLEGNTNDSGSREGIEAIARIRGIASKDFILLD